MTPPQGPSLATNGHAAQVPSPTGTQLWDAISLVIERDFWKADLEGLKCIVCGAGSHYYPSERPVWTMVYGASSSGKTELVSQACLAMPQSRAVDDLTPQAFLSGFTRGPRNHLLPPCGGSSLWVAADFSTLASVPAEDLKRIAGSLRQIWDGKLTKDTGSGASLAWWGKVSLVACATPALEEKLGALRDLGERFLTVRWRSPKDLSDRLAAVRKARAQIGRVDLIRSSLKDLFAQLCDPHRFVNVDLPSDELMQSCDEIANLVAWLRTSVSREYDSKRSIIGIGEPELPTRISAALSQIARTHQAMFDLPPISESLALVRRVALDSIPPNRKKIIDQVHRGGLSGMTYLELLDSTKIPKTTLVRQLEELVALEVLAPPFPGPWEDRLGSFSAKFAAEARSSGLLC